jgi:hypothetical protein
VDLEWKLALIEHSNQGMGRPLRTVERLIGRVASWIPAFAGMTGWPAYAFRFRPRFDFPAGSPPAACRLGAESLS